ncbi:hypothetical protein CO661_13990 [Sinorhizobium fredii]|uniref:Uncharacterized protein n=1 Tax=Rhizobium fredii TaxID=380 RepID=A0A2A6LY55_RHIFR|nr:hypothetical protein [Sinorhizobium fredii]PDT47288.1 hypothetical protein CO661_13990 [Sinorhizobium fredii]
MADIVERLRERADSYRQSGPSAEHTAVLLEEAAIEIERLQRERNYAVRWANKSVDAVKEHDDAIIYRLQAALEKCQKALAAMIDPSCIAQSTVLNAFAMATEAEAAARTALEADQCAS